MSSTIGEYIVARIPSGRVAHLVHRGVFFDDRAPAAGCGAATPFWMTATDELRLCRKCAQHAEDRGVGASDLIAGGPR